jgi:uncharacterized membrane protein
MVALFCEGRAAMQCKNCGVDMVAGAAFCPSCGKPVEQSLEGAALQSMARTDAGLQPNIAGVLCYVIGIVTGIFFLLLDPYKRSPFIRFHAFQAIFLSIAWFAAFFAVLIFSAILPAVFSRVTWMLHSLVGLAFFPVWLFLMYKAYSNEKFKLPVIGDLAAKQA